MNRLQLAQHGYETIAPAVAAALDEETSDRAERWLHDEVCPVFEELARSRSFRLLVRWSCDRLTAGANSQERWLVEAVDTALVNCAKQLLFATIADATDEANDQLDPGSRVAIGRSERASLQLVAERPWFDLAFAEEFFHPLCDLGLRRPDHVRTIAFRERGELGLPLGDYVTRCMLARVDYWTAILEKIWNDTLCSRPGQAGCSQDLRCRLFDAKTDLDKSIHELKTACCAGPAAQRREASITLTQVYLAYSSSPDLGWLGFPGRRRPA